MLADLRSLPPLLFALGLAACAPTATPSRPAPEAEGPRAHHPTAEDSMRELADTRWTLVELPGDIVAAPGRRPSIHFEAGEPVASGSGGCNRWQGPYELGPETLRFGALAATQMACADGMEIETAFFTVLDAVRRWRLADGRLELLDEAGGLLARFEPATSG